MEIEQYLERDILTFLDSKTIKKEKNIIDREEDYGLYLTKDYIKELAYALDNDELTKAKKLFDELKDNYSSLPKNSIERKKIYSILEKMYDKIQYYVKIKEGKVEVIREGDSEIFKDRTDLAPQSTFAKAIKKSELSFGQTSKKILSEDAIENNLAVESKILEKSIKSTEGKKYYEERSEAQPEEDISKLNVFVRDKKNISDETNKSKTKKSSMETTAHVSPTIFTQYVPMYTADDNSKLERLKEEIIERTTEQVDKLKSYIAEKVLEELEIKLREEQSIENKKIEQLRAEIRERNAENVNLQPAKIRQEITDTHDIDTKRHRTDKKLTRYAVYDTEKFKKDVTKEATRTVEDIEAINKQKLIHRYHGKKLQVLYEEAIYTMFQNNYAEASKIFERILEMRPENKAAKIRLQECLEAMSNA